MERGALAVAAVIGILVWLPVELFQRLGVGTREFLFYAGAYPLMIGACFFISRWHKKRPWTLATVMMAANYIAFLVAIPGAGNMLPFEVLIYCVLTLLPAWAAKSGADYWETEHSANAGG